VSDASNAGPAPMPETASQEIPAAADAPLTVEDDLFLPEAAPQLPPEQRRRSLELLQEQVSTCSRCSDLLVSRTQTVFGEGPLDPELCFIGEAPGFNEDQQGRPFVGDAGQLLDKIIAACGFKREEVYIANVLKCRPPNNRTPLVTEADNCREYLESQLELIRPKYICAMGACAAQNLLKTTQSIGKMRKRFFDFKGIPVLCTYHPAYLLRTPDAKKWVWEDMKMLLARMGKPIPKR
jgi:DNA polymerase